MLEKSIFILFTNRWKYPPQIYKFNITVGKKQHLAYYFIIKPGNACKTAQWPTPEAAL